MPPVFDEVTVTELDVKGSVPPELNGRYFRNGANPQTGTSPHWFVGDGMIHGIEINAGKGQLVSKPLCPHPNVPQIRYRQDGTLLDMEKGGFDYNVSVANTSVIGHGGKILVLEEVRSRMNCQKSRNYRAP